MLNAKDRATLKSIATNLKDLVFIGKEGLTEAVIDQIDDNLYAHELIKIKVQKSVVDEIGELADKIAETCEAEIVSVIGSKILVYKVTSKPKFKHLL